jgi:hypothetical protein
MITSQHLDLAKGAFKLVAGMGVSKIVHAIINDHVTAETTLDQVKLLAGSAVISGMICRRGSEYVDTVYDETMDTLRGIKEQYHEIRNAE